MDRNEENRTAEREDVIELGIATRDTKGGPGIPNEDVGYRPLAGLSDQ